MVPERFADSCQISRRVGQENRQIEVVDPVPVMDERIQADQEMGYP